MVETDPVAYPRTHNGSLLRAEWLLHLPPLLAGAGAKRPLQ